jgi:very-short-patch-repair endonuclease
MKTDFYNRDMFYGASATTLRTAGILRRNMTLAELILWKKLKDRKIVKVKFRRQHPINLFIVDFYCHELKLVIEVDGEVHSDIESEEYDINRTAELNKYGIKVVRFQNDQIIQNIEKVINRIKLVITELTPL